MSNNHEALLFNYETTNRTDYRHGEIMPLVKTAYREKPKTKRATYTPLKDTHTLTDRKDPMPFDLMIKLKDIVRTNPRTIQQPYSKPPDLGREQAQKTRPRLVMTPAVSMDDISSKEARELLLHDIYTTTTQRALRQGVTPMTNSIQVPFPGVPAPANPIMLPKWHPPYVSPHWRMESVLWDRRQLRAKCDPDKEFYLSRNPKCSACDVSAYLKLKNRK